MAQQKIRTLGLAGCGTLGALIARGLEEKRVAGYRLVGAVDASPARAAEFGREHGCGGFGALEELIAAAPDYIIEAAGGPALREMALPVLEAGISLIPLSVGAFADQDFLDRVRGAALASGARVHLPSGSVGGFDIMGAARLQGAVQASMTTEKPPKALQSAVEEPLPGDEERVLFTGSAREAIRLFPKNVNVAVAAALATTGPENLQISIVSSPGLSSARHTVRLEGEFGQAVIQVQPKPAANLRSAALAAHSILYLLERLAAPVSF